MSSVDTATDADTHTDTRSDTGPQWSTWLDPETCAGLGIKPSPTPVQTVHMAVLAPRE